MYVIQGTLYLLTMNSYMFQLEHKSRHQAKPLQEVLYIRENLYIGLFHIQYGSEISHRNAYMCMVMH